jgi:cation transport ATPase
VVRALEELPGVKEAYAHFPEKRAVVVYDQAFVSPEQMCQALLKAGYVANSKGEESATRPMSPQGSGHTEQQQKKDLVCYCFGFTKQDIEQDLVKNGRSLIMEKIMAEKKTGGCDCKNLNPKGR